MLRQRRLGAVGRVPSGNSPTSGCGTSSSRTACGRSGRRTGTGPSVASARPRPGCSAACSSDTRLRIRQWPVLVGPVEVGLRRQPRKRAGGPSAITGSGPSCFFPLRLSCYSCCRNCGSRAAVWPGPSRRPRPAPEQVREFARGFIQISAVTLVYVLICPRSDSVFLARSSGDYAGTDLSAGRRSRPWAPVAPPSACSAPPWLSSTRSPRRSSRSAGSPWSLRSAPTAPATDRYRDHRDCTVSCWRLAPNLAGVAVAVMGSFHAALVTTQRRGGSRPSRR